MNFEQLCVFFVFYVVVYAIAYHRGLKKGAELNR